MSIWGKLLGGAAGLALGGPLGALVGAVLGHALVDRPVETRATSTLPAKVDPEKRALTFTIAVIALAAKMARADGAATPAEFDAFRRLFHVAKQEQANVDRFYRMAQRSVAGFEVYARQIAQVFGPADRVLTDLLDTLFLIALVDGDLQPAERAYLEQVAQIFGFDADGFDRILARHVTGDGADPYRILGLPRESSLEAVRAAYRALAMANHPDRLAAGGVPFEFQKVAQNRMAAINAAYETIVRAHTL
jgi:DnaJ like chaperone protein